MAAWRPIAYADFWDVPRVFVVLDPDRPLLFDARFDDVLDEYRDEYEVYLLPELPTEEMKGKWMSLRESSTCRLGCVPVSRSYFDGTLRKKIDLDLLPGSIRHQ